MEKVADADDADGSNSDSDDFDDDSNSYDNFDSDDDDDDDDDTDSDSDDEDDLTREERFNGKFELFLQQKVTVGVTAHLNERRIKSIQILQRQDEFPVRQRHKIDTQVEEFLVDLGDENTVAAAADDNDDGNARNERRLKLLSVLQRLQRNNKLTTKQRNKIDVLIDMFLDDLGDDIYEQLCNQGDMFSYQGLDSDRDTEEEVETAIRFFPHLLSRTKKDMHGMQCYPLQRLCNPRYGTDSLKAFPFIPTLVRLAIEFGSFQDNERGGLVVSGYNAIKLLTGFSKDFMYNDTYNQYIDNTCLTVLIQLRQMDLFKKEDIREYNLVSNCCNNFCENRVRFLVAWDSTSLLRIDEYGNLPLHTSTPSIHGSIRTFQIVFELGIRYYPYKIGISLMFRKKVGSNNNNKSPFQCACKKFGRKQVMKVIEDTLARYSEETPLNIVEALMMAAADQEVILDCVNFLLRREPDVLVRLISGSNNVIDDGDSDGDGGGAFTDAADDAANNDHDGVDDDGKGNDRDSDIKNGDGHKNDHDDGINAIDGDDDLIADANKNTNANASASASASCMEQKRKREP